MPGLHSGFSVCGMMILLSLGCTSPMILSGRLITSENWAFIARFCFLTEQGTFRYSFDLGDKNDSVKLLLYYDAPDQWPSVYPSNKTCREREAILSVERGQIVSLSVTDPLRSGCVAVDDSVRCNSYRKFRSNRPRWWFVALSDCSSETGLNVTYWMSLTNALPGKFWREHFSADEFYILPELMATTCLYAVLVIASFYVAHQLRSRRLLHVTYKLFVGSLLCQLTGVACETYSYVSLGLHGSLVPNASLIGQLFESCSELLYTVLMLLLAFGYTVTKSVLSPRQIRSLACFIFLSFVCQFSLYIYASRKFDPGLVLYIYESPPGYCLIALKLITWLSFVARCYRTTRKMNTKANFYASLISLGSVWFLCHPITVLAITLLIDKWVRESFVKACSLWIVLVGHATFLYVTRPSIANSRFPFHIRTCQVVPIGGEGQDHSYEPRTGVAISAFTVSQLSTASGYVVK